MSQNTKNMTGITGNLTTAAANSNLQTLVSTRTDYNVQRSSNSPEQGDLTTKQIIISQIRDIIASNGFTVGKILKTQERIQKIVPAYQRKPDHLLVIMNEIGEHLRETEASFKDWRKEGDEFSEANIDWAKAAEELADVVILMARQLVDDPSYQTNVLHQGMQADLLDAGYYVSELAERGQLLAASLTGLINPTDAWSRKIACFYYVCQYASLMPFGISGLYEAWVNKVAKVVQRNYVEQF